MYTIHTHNISYFIDRTLFRNDGLGSGPSEQISKLLVAWLGSFPLGRQALIRRAASALKYIVYNNYAVPNGIRTFFLLVDREKYQTNIDRQMLHKWYLF